MKFDGWNFWQPEFWNAFACSAGTRGPTDKRRLPLNSTCQIGLGNTHHEFSDGSGELQEGVKFAGLEL